MVEILVNKILIIMRKTLSLNTSLSDYTGLYGNMLLYLVSCNSYCLILRYYTLYRHSQPCGMVSYVITVLCFFFYLVSNSSLEFCSEENNEDYDKTCKVTSNHKQKISVIFSN